MVLPPTCLVTACSKASIEPLLLENKVNLVLSGHMHGYERSCAVYGYECQSDKQAPVHIRAGSAGGIFNNAPMINNAPKLVAWSEILLVTKSYVSVLSDFGRLNRVPSLSSCAFGFHLS